MTTEQNMRIELKWRNGIARTVTTGKCQKVVIIAKQSHLVKIPQ